MSTPKSVRTSEERFENLPGWDYAPSYIEDLAGYEGLRWAYVDEGTKDAPVFLCLHGEPSWGYLYRKMAPVFLKAGYRVVIPDMFGFGRSDKPVDDAVYTFDWHRGALKAFLERMELTDVCLVCQDWGGVLGLTLPMDYPDRFSRLIVMNTAIGIGKGASEGFIAWRDFMANTPDLDVAGLMKRATPILSDEEAAAYAAPFPGAEFKAGVRRFPALVPITPDMDGVQTGLKAVKFWSEDWTGDSFMAVGMQDPVLGPDTMAWLRSVIKGCPEPMEIAEGGHFVQEWAAPIAEAALKHFKL